MRSIKWRIRKIEAALGRGKLGIIVVHSREEAQEKICEYKEKYADCPLPTRILVVQRITKPLHSGLSKRSMFLETGAERGAL